MEIKNKRMIVMLLSLLATVLYILVTDPNMDVINLAYGTELIFTLKVFLVFMLGYSFIEMFPELFTENHIENEKLHIRKSMEDPVGAGLLVIAKSIKLLGAAILLSTVIVVFA